MQIQDSQQKNIYISLLIATLFLFFGTVFILSRNSSSEKTQINKKEDGVHTDSNAASDIVATAFQNNPKLKQSSDALLVKDYQKAISLAKEVLETASDVGERSMAEFNLASAYVGLKNIPAASSKFYSIYNNARYAKTTRASALNTLMQQYNGTKNKEFLTVVIDDVATRSDDQIKDIVYQKIYDVYPLGIATAHIGTKRLSQVAQGDRGPASDIYLQTIVEIDSDIDFQSKGVGSAHNVPNILLSKAKFMIYAYTKFKLSSVEEISEAYEKAANLSRANNYKITEQFAYLNYINFLSLEKEFAKAEQVFEIFSSETPQDMVLQNLRQGPIAQNWPGISLLSKQSAKLKEFLDRYQIKY